jgi:lysocardiolipin and lysophospholipid acyltransferase
MTKINLPDRMVVMANHQAYTDWMYLWILACYSGHSRGVIILLKEGLKKIPVVGWGMVSLAFYISTRTYIPYNQDRSRRIGSFQRESPRIQERASMSPRVD